MSDDTDGGFDVNRAMLAMTDVTKPKGMMIGRIGKDITLPRPVRAASLVASVIGGFIGLFLAAIFASSLQAYFYAAVLGGGAGVGIVTYSPLQGESFTSWAKLQPRARRRRTRWEGKPVRVYAGLCPLPREAAGPVRIVASAAPVRPDAVDERGVLRSEKNQNIDRVVPMPDPRSGLLPKEELDRFLFGTPADDAVGGAHLAPQLPVFQPPQTPTAAPAVGGRIADIYAADDIDLSDLQPPDER